MNPYYSKKSVPESIKKEYKNIEKVTRMNILVNNQSIEEMVETLNISWVNKGISDQYYPFKDSFEGEWEIEVLRPKNKMDFNDIVDMCKEDGYSPATIFHMFSFMLTVKDIKRYHSLLAPGSLHIDDFEHVGCVMLTILGEKLNLGFGNWRGFKIDGCDVLRVKKIKK